MNENTNSPRFRRRNNPLQAFSITGTAAELSKKALAQKPFLGRVCLKGQATVWYAQYGTGKTLLCLGLLVDAIDAKRVDPANVYYINADDSSVGLAQKVGILEAVGVNVLAPGHNGFTHHQLMKALKELTELDEASEVVIIVDTLKKFVDLMAKKEASVFAEAVRAFVLKNGTFLALAHTNKAKSATGKAIPEGTADILNDFDCGYVIDEHKKSADQRVVKFECVKSRGVSVDYAFYAYDCRSSASYFDKLGSVIELDELDLEDRQTVASSLDEDIVASLYSAIKHNSFGKMELVREVSRVLNASRRRVIAALEHHCGDDPEKHYWTYDRTDRGRHVYRIYEKDDAPE